MATEDGSEPIATVGETDGGGNTDVGNGPDLGGYTDFTGGAAFTIDPASIGGPGFGGGGGTGDGGEAPRKRRGRQPGSKNKSTGQKASVDISSLELLLYTTHSMMAMALNIEELALSNDEARKIAESGAKVARHYNVTATAKSLDIANLAIVLGTAYGSRFIAYNQRMKMEAAEKKAQAPSNVIFPDPGFSTSR